MERILIVDDSTTSRMIIKRCFQIAGLRQAEYLEAEDGLKALEIVDRGVDLILTDLKMPRMDGHTFVNKLRIHERTRDVPVIVISSMGSDVTEEQLKDMGVNAVIRKPVSPEKVIDALGVINEV